MDNPSVPLRFKLLIIGLLLIFCVAIYLALFHYHPQQDIHIYSSVGDNIKVKQLLDDDPTIVNVYDYFGNTPVHLAVSQGHLKTTKMLIDRGADISLKTKRGDPILFLAIQNSHNSRFDIIRYLLSKGADMNAHNNQGDDIIDVLEMKADYKLLELLSKYKNNKTAK